jgi:xylulokinase
LYLGLDCSTQSLTAIVIDVGGGARRIVFEDHIDFDRDLAEYGTKHGVLPSADPLEAVSSPLLWADALDRMMARVAAARLDLRTLRAVAGSGQQHGSVYLTAQADARWRGLSADCTLPSQLEGIFSRPVAPIWMDASTAAECAAITARVGGEAALLALTGSRAFERFTGPQIRKFADRDPAGYARTDRIHLVSSYLASLLAARHAPIDHGDGAGMNLMDLRHKVWAPAALDATAPGLASKLPDLAPSWTIVGPLAPFWRSRYRLPPAKVVAWSGDNPSSLIGTGLVEDGRIAISLGTSDTLFGLMRAPRVDPSGSAHVFGSPTGDYMGLVCFKNGSLARERVRDAHGLDWDGFSEALRSTPAGNGGAIMLPWFDTEITPRVPKPGVRRFDLEASDAAANVRGVVEGQLVAMARHSRWMDVDVRTIVATGGASDNREILQVMADVFDADVARLETTNSACLGAALRAWQADLADEGRARPWTDIVAGFTDPLPARVRPESARVRVYAVLKERHAACEAEALRAD